MTELFLKSSISQKSFYPDLRWVLAFVEKQLMRKLGDGNSCVQYSLTSRIISCFTEEEVADSTVFADITPSCENTANNNNRYVWSDEDTKCS